MEGYAIHGYQAETYNEVSLLKGTMLNVIEEKPDKNWVKVEAQLGVLYGSGATIDIREPGIVTGWVPANRVQLLDTMWYHGPLSRLDAENKLLRQIGNTELFIDTTVGMYLVRISESSVGNFSISVLSANSGQRSPCDITVKHFKIIREDAFIYYLYPSRRFTSINALIKHYKSVSLSKILDLKLGSQLYADGLINSTTEEPAIPERVTTSSRVDNSNINVIVPERINSQPDNVVNTSNRVYTRASVSYVEQISHPHAKLLLGSQLKPAITISADQPISCVPNLFNNTPMPTPLLAHLEPSSPPPNIPIMLPTTQQSPVSNNNLFTPFTPSGNLSGLLAKPSWISNSIDMPASPDKMYNKQLARAVFAYQSGQKGDLEFNKGDIIEVEDSSDETWMTGRLYNGNLQIGIFPANYVEFIRGQ